jgi:beta-xylosidase
MGPWELGPNNPLWRNGVEDSVQNTGHADLVEDNNGKWWAVMLGVRPVRRKDAWEESVLGMLAWKTLVAIVLTMLGRETFLAPLEWVDGWPVINGGNKIDLNSRGPGLYELPTAIAWRDEFSDSQMQLGWYRKSRSTSIPDSHRANEMDRYTLFQ